MMIEMKQIGIRFRLRIGDLLPQHALVRRFFLFSVASALLTLGFLGFTYQRLPPEVPLFYSNPWGKEQLARPYFLFLPLALSCIFLALNIVLAKKSFAGHSFVRDLLYIGTGLIFLLATVTTVRIVFLII